MIEKYLEDSLLKRDQSQQDVLDKLSNSSLFDDNSPILDTDQLRNYFEQEGIKTNVKVNPKDRGKAVKPTKDAAKKRKSKRKQQNRSRRSNRH